MTSTTIKFGIVGTGAIARVHAQCIDEIQDAELIALASSSPQRAKEAQAHFSPKVYDDFRAMMDHEKLDVVIICTQSGAHLAPTLAAAERGIHVLSEKPLEVSVERAQHMIDACKNAKVKLGCIFQNRFSEGFMAMKTAIDEGRLGKVLMGNASINWYRDAAYYTNSPWRGTLQGDGGAALINQGIHTIDLLQCLMGDVAHLVGKTATQIHPIEGEDVAAALLEFKNGALGTITGGTALYPGYPERLEVYGEKGSIILEAGEIKSWQIQGDDNPLEAEQNTQKSGSSDPMAIGHRLHKRQIEDMIDAILTNREPAVNGEEGLKSLRLIKDIYASSDKRTR